MSTPSPSVETKVPSELGVTYKNDENKERGNWTHSTDFLVSAIGYAVGLGNIWRFPYRAYMYGGASFLIPYTVTLVLAGLPLVLLEMSLGQFSSLGPLSVWKFIPILKGIGWGMVLINIMCGIYYNMIIAYGLYYLFASFTSQLPWQECRPEWKALYCCQDRSAVTSPANDTTPSPNQTYDVTPRSIDATTMVLTFGSNVSTENPVNCSGLSPLTPSEIYWRYVVLDISEGIDVGAGEIKWDLALCLLLAWIIVFLCLSKGIKSSGKIVYVTAGFPYVVLIILFIWNIQLEGAWLGIKFYIVPEWSKLANADVWYAAGTQIFYSLGIAFGSLETMASYNRFHNKVYRDAILVVVINASTSIFAGFVIFSVVGFMAKKTGLPVDKVVAGGPSLTFIAYPEGLAMMPVAPLWSSLFFLMIFTLGIDSQFAGVEAIKTAIADEFSSVFRGHARRHVLLIFAVCAVMFLCGLPQCSRAGVYVMTLFDWYSAGLNLIVISLLNVTAVAWIYGIRRFLEDVEMMIGFKPNYYWSACWTTLAPLMMMFIFISMIIDNSPIKYADYYFPSWATDIGWVMAVAPLVLIPGFAAYLIYQNGCNRKGLQELLRPTSDWGPALEEFRTGRYSSRPPADILDFNGDEEPQVVFTTSVSAAAVTPHEAPFTVSQPATVAHTSTEYSQL